MKARKLHVQNFRCFASKTLQMRGDQVIIQGCNGAGKTSVLEALHYGCYAHSFRTRRSEELIKQGASIFYIELEVEEADGTSHKIQIGYDSKAGSPGKAKSVLIDGKKIKKTSEIIRLYRAVSLTGEDIELIKGYPERRRMFLNQALFLVDHTWTQKIRQLKKVLSQRNSLLFNAPRAPEQAWYENLGIWSKQLWEATIQVQTEREIILAEIEKEGNRLLDIYFENEGLNTKLSYERKHTRSDEDFEQFWTRYSASGIVDRERALKRSSFGAHLDDFTVLIHGRCARTFASRGEQKLLTLLLKCAQLIVTDKHYKNHGILLLDDFLTDLDTNRLMRCIKMLRDMQTQAIITSPIDWDFLLPEASAVEKILLSPPRVIRPLRLEEPQSPKSL